MAKQKAYSTIGTKLFYKLGASGTYNQLCKIKGYPDLGGEPENIETTDLEDEVQTFVKGVQSSENMAFTANYTIDDYQKCKNVESLGGGIYFKLQFGDESYAEWKGELSVYVNGGDVNAVREMTISIIPSTKPELSKMTPKYKVIYNGNGNTSGTVPNPTEIEEGTTGTIADGTGLMKEGKAFEEWNTSDDGTGTSYAGGATSPTMVDNLVLFAIYED